MAVLSDPDRVLVWTRIMQGLSNDRESIALNKTDLRAAVNAADDWANSNAGAYNSALPAAAQAGLTASQKARLLMFVITRRFGL